MNNALKQYIDLHDAHLDAIDSHSAPQLNALRQEARKALDNAALPRKGSDDYEATDLNAVLAPDYGVNINHVDLSSESTTKFRCEVPNLSTCLYYVFNDTFRPSATAGQSGDNASVESFQNTKHPEVLAKHYGSVANPRQHLHSTQHHACSGWSAHLCAQGVGDHQAHSAHQRL